jgi:hypothetical protein
MPPPNLRQVRGQPSWVFRTRTVEAAVTRLGGQLGPVRFHLGRANTVQPFSIAPWAEEVSSAHPPILRALRGDFFCFPFGGNAASWRGEQHPVHGETANRAWRLDSLKKTGREITLRADLETQVRPARITKEVTLVDGEHAIYQRHVISGGRGPMCLGHHAMIAFPPAAHSGIISTSRFIHGQVFPGEFESPAQGGYQSLKPAARLTSLDRVPLLIGGHTDISRFPSRPGFEDLVLLAADPRLAFAWTAVTFPRERYAWFALRDPRVLRQTILWISNGGRHYAPWNGRHRAVMGLEDVTSYFHHGLAESARPNPLSRQGIPTTVTLHPARPTAINYVMAVAAVPTGFDRVAQIEPATDGVVLLAANGKKAHCRLNLKCVLSA